jgi:hypothetical protein
VASYRDLVNPEAIHFTGSLPSRVLLGTAMCLCLLLCYPAWMSPSLAERLVDMGLLSAIFIWCAVSWPREIVVNQYEVLQRRFLGKRVIALGQIGEVSPASEWGLPSRGGSLSTRSVRIVHQDGEPSIVFTARHTDLNRFLFELQRRHVALPADLAQTHAPKAPPGRM